VTRVVLICAPDPLSDELNDTLLWRADIERHLATGFEEAMITAVAAKPNLIVVDRELPQARRLVADLRGDARTRAVSIAIVARGDFEPSDLELLEAGANAILRYPPGPEWAERLGRLLEVAVRRHARIPVYLEFQAVGRDGARLATGMILDVSVSGVLLETQAPLEVGAEIDVRFRLSASGPPVEARARVVRVAARSRYGAEFQALDDGGRERLARFTGAA